MAGGIPGIGEWFERLPAGDADGELGMRSGTQKQSPVRGRLALIRMESQGQRFEGRCHVSRLYLEIEARTIMEILQKMDSLADAP